MGGYEWQSRRVLDGVTTRNGNCQRHRRQREWFPFTRVLACTLLCICSSTTSHLCYAWVDNFLVPGTALTLDSVATRRRRSTANPSLSSAEQVVIFEHTSHGAGGLVLNRPTPVTLQDLNIPRFSNSVFGQHRLYFGCGILAPTVRVAQRRSKTKLASEGDDQDEDEDEVDDEDDDNVESQVAIGDMSPWFWYDLSSCTDCCSRLRFPSETLIFPHGFRIHDLPLIPGSYLLAGAADPLYMGGNVDVASDRLKQQEEVDPRAHFKFFWKAKVWASGQLEDELEQGIWKTVGPLSADQAFLH